MLNTLELVKDVKDELCRQILAGFNTVRDLQFRLDSELPPRFSGATQTITELVRAGRDRKKVIEITAKFTAGQVQVETQAAAALVTRNKLLGAMSQLKADLSKLHARVKGLGNSLFAAAAHEGENRTLAFCLVVFSHELASREHFVDEKLAHYSETCRNQGTEAIVSARNWLRQQFEANYPNFLRDPANAPEWARFLPHVGDKPSFVKDEHRQARDRLSNAMHASKEPLERFRVGHLSKEMHSAVRQEDFAAFDDQQNMLELVLLNAQATLEAVKLARAEVVQAASVILAHLENLLHKAPAEAGENLLSDYSFLVELQLLVKEADERLDRSGQANSAAGILEGFLINVIEQGFQNRFPRMWEHREGQRQAALKRK